MNDRFPVEGEEAENVEVLDVITRHDIPVERVFKMAQGSNLASIVILGFTEGGEEYFGSSLADGSEVLWLLERAKHNLLTLSYEKLDDTDEEDE